MAIILNGTSDSDLRNRIKNRLPELVLESEGAPPDSEGAEADEECAVNAEEDIGSLLSTYIQMAIVENRVLKQKILSNQIAMDRMAKQIISLDARFEGLIESFVNLRNQVDVISGDIRTSPPLNAKEVEAIVRGINSTLIDSLFEYTSEYRASRTELADLKSAITLAINDLAEEVRRVGIEP